MDRIVLVTTFDNTLSQLDGIIKNHWNILEVNLKLKDIFKNHAWSPIVGQMISERAMIASNNIISIK